MNSKRAMSTKGLVLVCALACVVFGGNRVASANEALSFDPFAGRTRPVARFAASSPEIRARVSKRLQRRIARWRARRARILQRRAARRARLEDTDTTPDAPAAAEASTAAPVPSVPVPTPMPRVPGRPSIISPGRP